MSLNTFADKDPIASSLVNENFEDLASGKEMHYNSAWIDYTPTWTTLTGQATTLGNGTLVGRYLQIGTLVQVRIFFKWGSTTSVTGTAGWRFALPVLHRDNSSDPYTLFRQPLGTASFFDDSANSYVTGFALLDIATQHRINPVALGATGTYATSGSIASASPFTWASGDEMTLELFYESKNSL